MASLVDLHGVDMALKTSECLVRKLQIAANVFKSQSQKKLVLKLITLLEQVARRRSALLKYRWQFKKSGTNTEQVKTTQTVLIRTCAAADKILARILTQYPDTILDANNNQHENNNTIRTAQMANDATALLSCKTANPEMLESLRLVIENLRQIETSYDFHGQIICDASTLIPIQDNNDSDNDSDENKNKNKNKNKNNHCDYSLENFAYGSTPLSTWLELMSDIQTQGLETKVEWGIMGSSCGWMVFYAALLTEEMAQGWEILPSLHATAVEIADTNISNPSIRKLVQFHCQDALKADISTCGAILIAGQCWEPWLLDAMYSKIQMECKIGTILLTYNGNTSLENWSKSKTTTSNRNFKFIFKKRLPVSWGTVDFHVWVLEETTAIVEIPPTAMVRQATPQDSVPTLTKLINDAYKVGEFGIFVDDAENPFYRMLGSDIEELINQNNLLLLIELSSSNIIGCVKLNKKIEETKEGVVGEWGCLAVHSDHQKKGYGTLLQTTAEMYLKEAGCTIAQLELLTPKNWKHDHKERLRQWYVEKLGYSFKVKGDYVNSTESIPEGTKLFERFLLATDADFTVYRRRIP